MDTDDLAVLVALRNWLYRCFGKRAGGMFELTDAILTAGPQPSPVQLGLEPTHRRGWGSLYAALSHGTVNASALRVLLARYPLADEPVRVSAWTVASGRAATPRAAPSAATTRRGTPPANL